MSVKNMLGALALLFCDLRWWFGAGLESSQKGGQYTPPGGYGGLNPPATRQRSRHLCGGQRHARDRPGPRLQPHGRDWRRRRHGRQHPSDQQPVSVAVPARRQKRCRICCRASIPRRKKPIWQRRSRRISAPP